MKGLLWAVQTCGKSLKHWGTGCSSLRSYNFHHRWASFFLWFSSFLFLLSFRLFFLHLCFLYGLFGHSFFLSCFHSLPFIFSLFCFLIFFCCSLSLSFFHIFCSLVFFWFFFYTFLNPFQGPIHSFCSFSFVNCYLHWFLLFNELSFI